MDTHVATHVSICGIVLLPVLLLCFFLAATGAVAVALAVAGALALAVASGLALALAMAYT